MTAPVLSDGEPYHGVIAVVDESSPVAGAGVYYILSAVVIPEPATVIGALEQVVGARRRPFHFSEEGPEAIERMVGVFEDAGLVATSLWSSVGRRGQVAARRKLLHEHVRLCADQSVGHLIVEGGDDAGNERDRSVILDAFQADGGVPFRYDWRSKAEPLVWIADAASGIAAAHLLGRRAEYYERLHARGLMEVAPR